MTFDEWWDANDMDSDADANYTVSEQVWKAARRDVLTDENPQPPANQGNG